MACSNQKSVEWYSLSILAKFRRSYPINVLKIIVCVVNAILVKEETNEIVNLSW